MFRAVQAKDVPALAKLVRKLDRVVRNALQALPELAGGMEVLTQARQQLPEYRRDQAGACAVAGDCGVAAGRRHADLF